MMANLERCKAQDTLHNGNFDPTDYRGVFVLHLRAHGDINKARRAQSAAAAAYADQQIAAARQRR